MIYTVTCHTEKCGNCNIPITMETDATVFYCGVCGNQITDIVEVEPEPAPKAK